MKFNAQECKFPDDKDLIKLLFFKTATGIKLSLLVPSPI
jgi:hypothetical protein